MGLTTENRRETAGFWGENESRSKQKATDHALFCIPQLLYHPHATATKLASIGASLR